MKFVKIIKKKLFKDIEILEQRQIDDFSITRCKIFGTMRPRLFCDIDYNLNINVKIFNNKKKVYEKNYKKGGKTCEIVQPLSLFKSRVLIIISNKDGLLIKCMLDNSLIRKILKKIYSIIKLSYKAIKLLWNKHHFIVPPKMWGYYIRKLKEKIQWEESNIEFLDPFNVDDYNEWIVKHEKHDELKKLKYNPKISIALPVYNVPINYLRECIDSVINQNYKNWELCIADDKSTQENIKETLEEYKNKDDRIKVIYRKQNGNISKATNSAFKIATGEYIALLDNDDVLTSDALYEVAKALNVDKNIDFIYSDEDKLNNDGKRCDPYFKSDWSPDTMLSNNYLCHLSVFKKTLLDKVGGERSEYDGAQDYDLFLRLTEKAKKIHHISKILYHWRIIPGSTSDNIANKSYAVEAGRKAIESALKRRKIKGSVDSNNDGTYVVNYHINNPKVSIILPTRDLAKTVEACLKSIYSKTTYKNYEIILVDNNSQEKETFELFEKYKKKYDNFKVLRLECDFNFSYINNKAVEEADGDYILLLNNDTEVITKDWLEKMVMYASQPHVGAVGAKLYYPDNTIQHGGIVLGINGLASHAYLNETKDYCLSFGKLKAPCNYSGVTAACLMVSKKKYLEVGGLEEELKVNFNDVDFNLKLLEKGYYNVFLPIVELYHYESKSRGLDIDKKKYEQTKRENSYMVNKWGNKIVNDRFYNINYSKNYVHKLEK